VGASKIYRYVGDYFFPGQSGDEAALDVEDIMGVAPGILTEYWFWGSMDFCADLKNWTGTILASDDPPLVHSVSYGWQGDLAQVGCKAAHVNDVDVDLMKLAARGITIIFSSGDSGSGYSPGQCRLFQEVNGTEPKQGAVSGGLVSPVPPKLWPSWPASSPWVTAVGATRLVRQDVTAPEMATDQFGSGGGFSDMWPAFQSQVAAVEGYLRTAPGLPPSGSFPPGGRATPDVSALGEGYQVMINGQVWPVGGTSASAPMFAALVSLLNEARLAAKKPPMGYMNPWIYAHPEAFRDVTLGTNAIDRDGSPVPFGFPCAKGWDPATGMGTPIFGNMLAAANAAVAAPREEIIV